MSGSGDSVIQSIFSCFPSPSTSPPPSNAHLEESAPAEFVCPVSGLPMEDPVVVPTGHSFQRSCIEACNELGYIPPLLLSSSSSSSSSVDLSSFSLIPNIALRAAILRWCDDGLGRPSAPPLSQEDARSLVERLKTRSVEDSEGQEGQSSQPRSSTSDAAPSEERIFQDLRDPKIAVRESALDALFRHANARDHRSVSLCTPRIVASIALILRSDRIPILQVNACKAILALSEMQANRIKIAGSGAVPPLLHVLARATVMRCRIDAASTICNLAQEERNRTIMGDLNAIPPLLETFYDRSLSHIVRREAAMAIYFLTLCPSNLAILANVTAVPRLLRMTTDISSNEAIVLRSYAMRLLNNLNRETKIQG